MACTGFGGVFDVLNALTSPPGGSDLDIGIAIALPIQPTTAAPGAPTIIRWADIATVPGTVVRIAAQRENPASNDPIGDPIQLVGDGTPGSGRDALADGDADEFDWDLTGVRVGTYNIIATIEAPDGTTAEVQSRDPDRNTTGVFNVITALPVPTLNFVQPAADTTVTTGNTFDITWTDNGDANEEALLTLGLDTDNDHDSGNEIILLRDDPLSNDGTNGMFTFNFLDADNNGVPDGTFIIFARLDDNANDIVTVEAPGNLILNP